MRKFFGRGVFCAAAVVYGTLWSQSAHAGTITLETDFKGISGIGYFLTGEGGSFVSGPFGSVTMTNPVDVAGVEGFSSFEAYCVDILGPYALFGGPTATVNATGALMTDWSDPSTHDIGVAGAGGAAASLYNQYNPIIQGQSGNVVFGDLGESGITATADIARTALAMAIWNVLYDREEAVSGNYNVSYGQGDFYVWCPGNTPCAGADQAAATELANAFLSTVGTGQATWLQLSEINGNDVQDFMGPQAVPEPASLLLLATGGAGMLIPAMRRRRNRKAE